MSNRNSRNLGPSSARVSRLPLRASSVDRQSGSSIPMKRANLFNKRSTSVGRDRPSVSSRPSGILTKRTTPGGRPTQSGISRPTPSGRHTPNGRATMTPVRLTTGTSALRAKSPNSRKEVRPLADKIWQKEQLQRVTTFMHKIDPTLILKPVSINTFLFVVGVLIEELDKRIPFNAQTVKETLLNILTLYEYPTTISQSFLKCPNTPRNFPTVLGIYSFLLDRIDEKNTDSNKVPENIEDSKNWIMKQKIKENLCAICFHYEDKDECDKIYSDTVESLKDFYMIKNNTEQQKEIEILDETDFALETELKKNNKEFETLNKETEHYMDEARIYTKRMENTFEELTIRKKEKQGELDVLEHACSEQLECVEKTRAQLSTFNCTNEEVKELANELNVLQHVLELKSQNVSELTGTLVELDQTLVNTKKELQHEMNQINTLISSIDFRGLPIDKINLMLPIDNIVWHKLQETLSEQQVKLNKVIGIIEAKENELMCLINGCDKEIIVLKEKRSDIEEEVQIVTNQLADLQLKEIYIKNQYDKENIETQLAHRTDILNKLLGEQSKATFYEGLVQEVKSKLSFLEKYEKDFVKESTEFLDTQQATVLESMHMIIAKKENLKMTLMERRKAAIEVNIATAKMLEDGTEKLKKLKDKLLKEI